MNDKKDVDPLAKIFGSGPEVKQLEAGTVLNSRYEIVRCLDDGGAVYLATDRSFSDALRAVREIGVADGNPVHEEKAIADFNREMLLLTSLVHPSIPIIYDYFYAEQQGRFYLVIDYVVGGDLESHLRSAPGGKIDEKTVTQWAIQVADLLEYLHTRPKAHFYHNLEPAKLVIDGNTNRVMLVDFGIARRLKQADKNVSPVGAVGYCPPELIPRVDRRSDVYSLGAIMFHLLTGADPQANRNSKPRQITASISNEMERILMRAMEYLPKDRFATARELREALTAHLEGLMAQSMNHPTHEDACSEPEAPPQVSPARDNIKDSEEILRRIEESDASPEESPNYPDENVQFTVYRPAKIKPARWYPLLAYAHLGQQSPDEDTFDPIAYMEEEAERILVAQDVKVYRRASEDSLIAIPRQGEISFVPFIEGVEFNPPSISFFWQESLHRQEFRMRASAQLDGKTARGQMSVFLGTILLAEINLSIEVTSIDDQLRPQREKPARPYRKIFPSYSHKDREIVAQIEHYAQITGDKYMRDMYELRSGQNWKKWMAETIAQADIFQLFWSTNSHAF